MVLASSPFAYNLVASPLRKLCQPRQFPFKIGDNVRRDKLSKFNAKPFLWPANMKSVGATCDGLYSFRILANSEITGTAPRLSFVFGSPMCRPHTLRLTVMVFPS